MHSYFSSKYKFIIIEYVYRLYVVTTKLKVQGAELLKPLVALGIRGCTIKSAKGADLGAKQQKRRKNHESGNRKKNQ